MTSIKILAPCGILGYGYPLDSFMKGMRQHPDAIVVDAGSTDAGPHKLGAGVAIVSKQACKKDLTPMITCGLKEKIPVIIGSAGGSGSKVHVEWTYDIVKDVIKESGFKNVKIAIIWADIPKTAVEKGIEAGSVQPLGKSIPELTRERFEKTNRIVAQMGHEPILKALEDKADIIICGRAYDPSPFAAVAAFYGFDLAYGYHMGKILECAALCAVPGTTKDCILGTLYEAGFLISPLSSSRKCTPLSVAAHTFYEKDHPYLLHGPGYILNLENCSFRKKAENSVFVTGSRIIPAEVYCIKLEGAMQVAYRTFVVAGIRDPLMISQIESIQEDARCQVAAYYSEYDEYTIRFINYGINGVMGKLEPEKGKPHEVGVIIDVLAGSQEMADAICSTTRSTLLHFGYEGRKSTAGNLAFPFAPSDVSYGAVYEFSVYHLMEVPDGKDFFPREVRMI